MFSLFFFFLFSLHSFRRPFFSLLLGEIKRTFAYTWIHSLSLTEVFPLNCLHSPSLSPRMSLRPGLVSSRTNSLFFWALFTSFPFSFSLSHSFSFSLECVFTPAAAPRPITPLPLPPLTSRARKANSYFALVSIRKEAADFLSQAFFRALDLAISSWGSLLFSLPKVERVR